MSESLDEFQKFRTDLNQEILKCGHLGLKRYFALDHQAYEAGALDSKTKELLGLVASTVSAATTASVTIWSAHENRLTRSEVIDALNVAIVVGGSTTIPHLRRAFGRMSAHSRLRT